ncbi:FtsX-like permease family protein [Longimicrobium sp.]|jgi:lipoprotein-releasing system permease protein|uniref:FtsX-like permease family protein n=1 Tax=Longimicrobium sp. TaxID=2029185 RepID=UPI002F930561
MSLEWRVARRYLSSRRGTRFLSLITLIAIGGVAVGVMALIIVTAVMNGLQNELRRGILGVNPHVFVLTYGEGMRMAGWRGPIQEVRKVEGVVAAGPFVHTEVGLRNRGGYAEGAVLRGIVTEGDGSGVTDIPRLLREARISLGPTRSGLAPIAVGAGLAGRLGLIPGDTVTVVSFTNVRMTPMGPSPEMELFEFVGAVRTGMWEYDNKFSYTSLTAAQHLTGLNEAVSGLEVRLDDPQDATEVSLKIDKALGLPYRTDNWMTMNGALFNALKLEKLALFLILLLIVIVAAFNIVSTLVMVVTDKTREIGILKSMGMTSRRILRLFMVQGLVIGMVGAAIGGAGGVLVAWVTDYFRLIRIPGEIYFVSHLPVKVDPVDLVGILLATVVISFLATVYPAWQAARLDPVEAIRHE